MKYLRQLLIILTVSCIGELLKQLLPFPIPASIYGLVLMLLLLISGKLSLDSVKHTAAFLVEIMPVLFIPAGVGLMVSWGQLTRILLPVCVIIIVSLVLAMVVTGKITDALLDRKGDRKDE